MLRITGRTILIIILLSLPAGYRLAAQVPGMISYQARIVDETTGPINDTRTMRFSIYSQAEGGTPIWYEEQNVTIINGVANVMLGSVTTLSSEIFMSGERYLSVKIGSGQELRPRERLLSVPYAMRAESATIRITPSGGISSTDVTSAIQELDAEKLSLAGGTLKGRLNVYNEKTNDVGLDALSADSAAILAMNSGSTAPALVAYNYGDGHGLFSFAEIGAALFAANETSEYSAIIANNSAEDGMAIYAFTESSLPTCIIKNEGEGPALFLTSNSQDGITIGADGEGDLGTITATNQGNGPGIYGYSKAGYGVRALSDGAYAALSAENTGSGTGLWGVSNSGIGVYGYSEGSNFDDYGVFGYSEGSAGVYGSSGSSMGIWGYAESGVGIWGSSNENNGVVAMCGSDDYASLYVKNNGSGSGIYAKANDANGMSIYNNSDSYPTIWSQSEGKATAVYGYGKNGGAAKFITDSYNHWAVYVYSANNSSSNAGLRVDGYATITGGVRSTMLTSAGLACAHSISSPQAEFSFSGSASLSGGEAEVAFASTWQECISGAAEYRVLITPTEMCNGICCIEKNSTGFKAKELMNGTSNASFDWMVRAVKKGSSTEEILLAGAGQPDVGMEIIEPEEERIMQAKIEPEKEKRKEPVAPSPSLSSAYGKPDQLKQGPTISSFKQASPEMEERIQQIKEYKERLKQKAQGR